MYSKKKKKLGILCKVAQLKLLKLKLWSNLPYFIRSRKDQVILVTLCRSSLGLVCY